MNITREIPLDVLTLHPERSNHMRAEDLCKLRRHIERTGYYEPLTVRPHPYEPGRFQVLNGHNRLRVLRAMGVEHARCSVWEIGDEEARLCVATLNTLTGREIPERNVSLREALLERFDIAELAALLPDSPKRLAQIWELAAVTLADLPSVEGASAEGNSPPVVLSYFLREPEARSLDRVLDILTSDDTPDATRGEALVRLAQDFSRRCRDLPKEP